MVLHVMVHTDATTDGLILLETPADGILADKFARAWRAHLTAADLDVRQVSGSGATPLGMSLSSEYPGHRYAQVRLSVSQTFFLEGRPWRWETLKKLLLESLTRVIAEVQPVSDPGCSSTDPR